MLRDCRQWFKALAIFSSTSSADITAGLSPSVVTVLAPSAELVLGKKAKHQEVLVLPLSTINVIIYVHKVNGCKYYDCHYRKRSLKQTAGHFLEYQESYYRDEDAGDIKCQVWIHIIVSS